MHSGAQVSALVAALTGVPAGRIADRYGAQRVTLVGSRIAAGAGAVFALASATIDITTARPEAIATGMRTTFAAAAILIVVALAIAVGSRALVARLSLLGDVS